MGESIKKRILIVDDVSENLDIAIGYLKDLYEISVAKSGKSALDLARKLQPDLILLDIMMPEMDGYEVCTKLKQDLETSEIPVIFLTALSQQEDEKKGLSLGAVDYITKPFDASLLKTRIKTQLELKDHRDNLQHLVDEKTGEIKKTRDAALTSMAFLAEFRDPETGAHVIRTKEYVRVLAQHLKPIFPDELTDAKIEAIYQSAELHDMGKVGIPDSILLKNGKLTDEEMEEMKKHTIYGGDVLRRTEELLGSSTLFLKTAKEICEGHHERYDGSGYPHHLKGDEIPLSARLMSVADVYDALRSKRSYKEGFSHEEVVKILTQGDDRTKPEHFDPRVLQAFVEAGDKFKKILEEHPDTEEIIKR